MTLPRVGLYKSVRGEFKVVTELMTLSLPEALHLASVPAGMDPVQTQAVLEWLVSGQPSPEEGGAVLRAWAARGETGVELAAAVRFLRQHAVTVPVHVPCFDLCGTGGSGLHRYNISTTVAFIAAAAGIPVAKHGNRGSKRPNGSFDLLDELGIPFELSVEREAQLLAETGVCFLFARTHHPAVGRVVPYRKEAGTRTIFNLAGPLSNPAQVRHQLIGTIAEHTAHIVAEALNLLKMEGSLVVWGEPGIDEISITGRTGYLHIGHGAVYQGHLDPARPHSGGYETLPGGDAPENAKTFFRLLSGTEKGALLDMLVENAGAAIDLWNRRAPALGGPGAQEARDLIRSGAALAKFEQHRDLAQRLAQG